MVFFQTCRTKKLGICFHSAVLYFYHAHLQIFYAIEIDIKGFSMLKFLRHIVKGFRRHLTAIVLIGIAEVGLSLLFVWFSENHH